MSTPSSRRRLAALLLATQVAMTGPLAAQELGRLFFTPEQRAALDKARFAPEKQQPEPRVAEAKQQAPEPPPPPVGAFRVEGLVVRSAGPNTAWVDGHQVLRKGRTFKGVAVDPGAAGARGVTVRMPGEEGEVPLKPGQTFDPASARITELAPRHGPPAATGDGARDGADDAPPAGDASP